MKSDEITVCNAGGDGAFEVDDRVGFDDVDGLLEDVLGFTVVLGAAVVVGAAVVLGACLTLELVFDDTVAEAVVVGAAVLLVTRDTLGSAFDDVVGAAVVLGYAVLLGASDTLDSALDDVVGTAAAVALAVVDATAVGSRLLDGDDDEVGPVVAVPEATEPEILGGGLGFETPRRRPGASTDGSPRSIFDPAERIRSSESNSVERTPCRSVGDDQELAPLRID